MKKYTTCHERWHYFHKNLICDCGAVGKLKDGFSVGKGEDLFTVTTGNGTGVGPTRYYVTGKG